jgi:hypothetical protein
LSGIINPETMHVDDLPGIWSPVQWELSEDDRVRELDEQATASLLWSVDPPEAVLRLLLSETDIQRVYGPPEGFDPDQQGEWETEWTTFAFRRRARLMRAERQPERLSIEYKLEGAGTWSIEIEPTRVIIERI